MKKKILAVFMAFTVSLSVIAPAAFASGIDTNFSDVVLEDTALENGIGDVVAGGVVDEGLEAFGGLIVQGIKNMVDRFIGADSFLVKPPGIIAFDEDFYNSEDGAAWRSDVNAFYSEAFGVVVDVVSSAVFGDILGKIIAGAFDELAEIVGEDSANELMEYDEMLRQFDDEFIKPYYKSIDDFVYGTFGILEVSKGMGTTSGTVAGKVSSGAVSFLSGFIKPLLKLCSVSPVCLAFLTVTFIFLGALMVRRFVRSFGRGR